MRHLNSVFHSLPKHVPWSELEQIVEKYGSDELARELTTKRRLIALLYGQFSGATSLPWCCPRSWRHLQMELVRT
jgi:hypothetical protein